MILHKYKKAVSLIHNHTFGRQALMFVIDAVSLLAIALALYFLMVGACLLDDQCFKSYYGVLQ